MNASTSSRRARSSRLRQKRRAVCSSALPSESSTLTLCSFILSAPFFLRASSTMTRRATRQVSRVFDLVSLDQLAPQLVLPVGLPGHVEDFGARAHVTRRILVALKTPLHLKRRHLKGERH